MKYGLTIKKRTSLGSLGSFGYETLVPNGDWFNWVPLYEPQYEQGFDTYGCTVWGTQNALETLLKRLTGKDFNFSERHVYIGTHTRPPGNDPYIVGEWIASNGMVPNERLPMTSSFDTFTQPDPLPQEIVDEALEFKKTYEIELEHIFTGNESIEEKARLITKYLKYSPLGVSVFAWAQDGNGLYYRPNNAPDSHWCVLIGETENSYTILDSYDQSIKQVRKDMNFGIAICYKVKINKPLGHVSLVDKIKAWFLKQLNLLEYFYEKYYASQYS